MFESSMIPPEHNMSEGEPKMSQLEQEGDTRPEISVVIPAAIQTVPSHIRECGTVDVTAKNKRVYALLRRPSQESRKVR